MEEPRKKTPLPKIHSTLLAKSGEQKKEDTSTYTKRIYPIVIFPYSQEDKFDNLRTLYEQLRIIKEKQEKENKKANDNATEKDKFIYEVPRTVINKQTDYNNTIHMIDIKKREKYEDFVKEIEDKSLSIVIKEWCVDSCQMWLSGFGKAFDEASKKEGIENVYWLIPGDFDYDKLLEAEKQKKDSERAEKLKKVTGKSNDIDEEISDSIKENDKNTSEGIYDDGLSDLFKKIKEIPEKILHNQLDMCVGEVKVPTNSSKQLIDTYGTYGLLYNWFPYEAQEIRKITDKPRTEFFAINHTFLREVLRHRWYAYEQTIVIFLHGLDAKKRIDKVELGELEDQDQGRDSLAAAMQQVERTERVLKLVWRERNARRDTSNQWQTQFRVFDQRSEQIRGAALVILQNLLK